MPRVACNQYSVSLPSYPRLAIHIHHTTYRAPNSPVPAVPPWLRLWSVPKAAMKLPSLVQSNFRADCGTNALSTTPLLVPFCLLCAFIYFPIRPPGATVARAPLIDLAYVCIHINKSLSPLDGSSDSRSLGFFLDLLLLDVVDSIVVVVGGETAKGLARGGSGGAREGGRRAGCGSERGI